MSVASWKGGYVAVGLHDAEPSSVEQRVWHSVDGQSWLPGTIEGDISTQDLQLIALASNGSRLVAIDAAGLSVLTSDDGATWRAVPDLTPFASSDGLFDVTFTAITATAAGGFVMVGTVSGSVASWVSSDGISWTRAPDQAAFAPGDNGAYGMNALIDLPTGLVAVGVAPNGDAVESWTSSDGLSWRRSASPKVPDAVIGTFSVNGLTSLGSSLVAVGAYPPLANWTGGRAEVWISPPAGRPAVDAVPSPARCDRIPTTLGGILSISPQDRLRCFGGRTLHIVGVQAEFGTDECQAFGPDLVLVRRIAGAINGCGPHLATSAGPLLLSIAVALAPSTRYRTPSPDGRTYAVVGHFDDPAARGCRSWGTPVADCRTVFVASSYAPRR
jgi:hypothetical protein